MRGGWVERLRHRRNESTPLDAVVDVLTPERPVHALPGIKRRFERRSINGGETR